MGSGGKQHLTSGRSAQCCCCVDSSTLAQYQVRLSCPCISAHRLMIKEPARLRQSFVESSSLFSFPCENLQVPQSNAKFHKLSLLVLLCWATMCCE